MDVVTVPLRLSLRTEVFIPPTPESKVAEPLTQSPSSWLSELPCPRSQLLLG